MRILLVRRHGPVRSIDLADRRWQLGGGALVLLAAAALAGTGGAVAWKLRRSGAWLRTTAALKKDVDAQRQGLRDIRSDAHRDMDALGIVFARLQAEDARRMALGDRIVDGLDLQGRELALHDDGAGVAADSGGRPSLDAAADGLGEHLSGEEQKLRWLESFLEDKHKQIQRMPHGMPADGYISSYFGPRTDPFTGKPGFHSGLDVAAPMGSPIHAVASGIVTYAGLRSGYGEVVEIDHGNGYVTRYAHASRLLVHAGQRVETGAVVGKVGSTGRSTGAHVHFEVWRNGRVIDPMGVVRSHG